MKLAITPSGEIKEKFSVLISPHWKIVCSAIKPLAVAYIRRSNKWPLIYGTNSRMDYSFYNLDEK